MMKLNLNSKEVYSIYLACKTEGGSVSNECRNRGGQSRKLNIPIIPKTILLKSSIVFIFRQRIHITPKHLFYDIIGIFSILSD